MANHLCIHLYDFATDRAPAVACAQTLDGDEFNPESEHLAHMPAHLWIETGDYTHALVSSQRAYELVTQLPEGDPHRAYYEPHDVYVGYSATMMRLDFDSALAWAKRLDAAIPKQGNAFEIETMLRFGHNEEAFGTAATAEAANEARAVAAIRLGNADAAKAIVAALGTREPGLATQARLDEARGNLADARADLQVLEKRQHDAYGGEMIPIVPAEEQLGGLELRAGDASRAERTFRDALARYPNDPWALFGLAAALDKEGETSGAAAVRAQLAGQGGDSSFMRIEDL
jgi:tetratricopeptide (TPR) repeat protein